MREGFRPAVLRRLSPWLAPLTVIALSLLICVEYVDRAVAEYAHGHWGGTRLFAVCAAALGSMSWFVVVLGAFTFGGVAWAAMGRRSPAWVGELQRAILMGCVALGTALLLKFGIGRSQVDPLYLEERLFELRPFTGTEEFAAFPSATMATATAIVIGLSRGSRKRQLGGATLLVLVAALMVVTNGHWVADLLGGLYLGAAVSVIIRTRRGTADPEE